MPIPTTSQCPSQQDDEYGRRPSATYSCQTEALQSSVPEVVAELLRWDTGLQSDWMSRSGPKKLKVPNHWFDALERKNWFGSQQSESFRMLAVFARLPWRFRLAEEETVRKKKEKEWQSQQSRLIYMLRRDI